MKRIIYIKQDIRTTSIIGHLYFEVDLSEGTDKKKVEVITDEDGIIKEAKSVD